MPTLVGSAFLLLAFASCAGGTASPAEAAAIPEGIWGGEGARLTVLDDHAVLELDCSAGRIAAPIRLDRSGAFDVSAALQRTTGAVPASDVQAPLATQTVRLTGTLAGDTILVTIVSVADGASESVALVRGREGRVLQCA